MATTNNKAIIQTMLAADFPVLPTLLWEFVVGVWEAVPDVVCDFLIFLVVLPVIVECQYMGMVIGNDSEVRACLKVNGGGVWSRPSAVCQRHVLVW